MPHYQTLQKFFGGFGFKDHKTFPTPYGVWGVEPYRVSRVSC